MSFLLVLDSAADAAATVKDLTPENPIFGSVFAAYCRVHSETGRLWV